MLQKNQVLKVIKRNLVKKCIKLFEELAEDEEKFKTFYSQFSKNIKLGLREQKEKRGASAEKLAKLLRYPSSKSGDEMTSLDDYIGRMKEAQEDIYYVSGDTMEAVKASPFVERLVSKGFEVLYMTDPIDEYALQQFKEYDGHKLICVSKEGLELPQTEEEKKEFEDAKARTEGLCTFIKDTLGDKVEKVVVTDRLAESPCCLVTGEYGYTARMEQIMRMQALRTDGGFGFMASKKTLEVNPSHPIVVRLVQEVGATETPSKSTKDLVWLLYDTALLTSGFSLQQPTAFAARIHRLITLGLSIDTDDDEITPMQTEVEVDATAEDAIGDDEMESVD